MGTPFERRPDLFPPDWVAVSRGKFLEILKTQYDNIPTESTSAVSSSDALAPPPPTASDDLFRDPDLVGEDPIPDLEAFTVEDELREYLKKPRYVPPTGSDSSPLIWWKEYEKQFPRLAQCARDILAIPGKTSVHLSLLLQLNAAF